MGGALRSANLVHGEIHLLNDCAGACGPETVYATQAAAGTDDGRDRDALRANATNLLYHNQKERTTPKSEK